MTKTKSDLSDLKKKYLELENIINNSPVIVFLWKNEENWPVEYVSENITQFGYTRDEFMTGKIQYSDIIFQEDLERVREEVASYSKSKLTVFSQEYRILSKSKEILWVDDRTFIRRNIVGEITHFQGVILNITSKKKIQEDLKNSEQKFRLISEQLLIGIGIIQDGKIVHANKKAIEIFGYSLDEMKNWSEGGFSRTIHPEDLERELKFIDQIQSNPEVNEIQFQTRGIKKSGESFWAESLFKKFSYYNRPALIGMFIDITERKKAEKALRLTQFSVDHHSTPAFWMGSDAKLIYVNEAACSSLGYTQEELLNMRVHDFDLDFPQEAWASHWEEVKDKGSFIIESHHRRKNGEIFPVEIHINYLKFESTEYNCAFAHDISERKEAERNLKQSEEKYREAFHRENFYKDLFTHDMRNILQSVSTSLDIYNYKLNNKTSFVQNKKNLEIIHFQINRGAHLIKNIKKFSEIESFEQTLEQIDIHQLIQMNASYLQKSFEGKNVSINLNHEKDKRFLIYGNDLLNEVIDNILLNSIIHNDNEDISISILISKIIKSKKPYIRIEFSDNGRGIEDSRKKIVFNRVYNQDKTTIGMGLGLSLVKIILEKLNGDAMIEDRIFGDYKQGCKFIILLPEVE